MIINSIRATYDHTYNSLSVDINIICKAIDENRDDYLNTLAISDFVMHHKKQFPIIQLEFIKEYMNHKELILT
jgi:hypothetical protein